MIVCEGVPEERNRAHPRWYVRGDAVLSYPFSTLRSPVCTAAITRKFTMQKVGRLFRHAEIIHYFCTSFNTAK